MPTVAYWTRLLLSLQVASASDGKPTSSEGWQATTITLTLIRVWHYVYILENGIGRQYVGSTENVKSRLQKHNKDEVPHTSKYKPWNLVHASMFPTKKQALEYERYLKSGSGTMFRYRHLVKNRLRKKLV